MANAAQNGRTLSSVLATLLWLLAALPASAALDAWQSLVNFPTQTSRSVTALTKDRLGNIYAAICSKDPEQREFAVVQKSSDRGVSWSTLDSFVPSDKAGVQYLSLGADPHGYIYAAGYLTEEEGRTRWIVRTSDREGNNWSTVDDSACWSAGRTAIANSIVAENDGNLFVAGQAVGSSEGDKSNQRVRWLVRQSPDRGKNWYTIDDFAYEFSARANAIFSRSDGLIVAGSGWNGRSNSCARWLVRKGIRDHAGRICWKTVDEFCLEEQKHGFDSQALGIAADARGNIYVVGRSYATAGAAVMAHWVTRRASPAGNDWTTVDQFQLEPGEFASAHGIAVNHQDGVFVVGQACRATSGSYWIVRKSASGNLGSWSVSDIFQSASSSHSVTLRSLLSAWSSGTMMKTSRPGQCHAFAIVSDAGHLYVGGADASLITAAVLRNLELGRSGGSSDFHQY